MVKFDYCFVVCALVIVKEKVFQPNESLQGLSHYVGKQSRDRQVPDVRVIVVGRNTRRKAGFNVQKSLRGKQGR